MPLDQQLKEVLRYMHHHRSERRAVIALGFCCIAFIGLKIYLNYRQDQVVTQLDKVTLETVNGLVAAEPYNTDSGFERTPPVNYSEWRTPKEGWKRTTLKPIPFDPNTVSESELLGMGLHEKTVSNLIRYRSKGGKFRKPEDLRKLYSLRQEDAELLIPFVRIAASSQNNSAPAFASAPAASADTKTNYRKLIVDINRSDTSEWIALPGIGSKLANRIVNFREKLGGFYKVEQVAETFGLPDSTWQKIRPMLKLQEANVARIDLNTVTVEEFARHPYVRFAMAKAIVAYRTQHGPFEGVEQLKRIMIVDEAFYNKLFPYLTAGSSAANGR